MFFQSMSAAQWTPVLNQQKNSHESVREWEKTENQSAALHPDTSFHHTVSVLLHLYTQKALSNWNNRLKSFPRVCLRSHFCSLHLQQSFSKTSCCSLWGNNLIIARAQWVCLTLNSNCVIMERLIKTLSASEELSLIHRRSKHRFCSLYDTSLKLLNISPIIVQEENIRFI